MWTELSWAIPESYTADDSWIVRSSDGRKWGDKNLHYYYMFVSLHDSDHEGAVRIFVGLFLRAGKV